MVQDQVGQQAHGGCPIGSLVGQLAENDPQARAAIVEGFDRWEAHIRDGLSRMQAHGKLRKDADPGVVVALERASVNSPVDASSWAILGTAKVRKNASSSARVVSNGNS